MDSELEARLLTEVKPVLTSLDLEQPTRFQGRWEDWFGDYVEISDLKSALADDNGTVQPLTRPFVKHLAEVALETPSDVVPLRRLFVATMMWGWGGAARARVFVRAAMCDRRFNDTLLSIQRQLRTGDIRSAYAAADGLNGCGEAFATKVLYFMGSPYQPGEDGCRHLILDSHVRRALTVHLGAEWGESREFWKARRRPVDVYLWFLRIAMEWAITLDCREDPDRVEQALFTMGRQIGQARRRQRSAESRNPP